jgi:predicted aspartyl protease
VAFVELCRAAACQYLQSGVTWNKRRNAMAVSRSIALALIPALVLGLPGQLRGQDVPAPVPAPAIPPQVASLSETPDFVQDFSINRTERMTVPVSINGSQTFPFIIDTGTERTVISTDLALRLALVPGPKLRLATVSGPALVDSVQIDNLAMNKIKILRIEAPALERRNIGGNGLLGLDTLEGHKVLLDFVAQKMDVLSSRKTRGRSKDESGMIVVTAIRKGGRMILSNARIGNMKVDIILDTGGQASLGNFALRDRLRKRDLHFDYVPMPVTDVMGRTTMGAFTQLKQIDVDGIGMENMPITFAENYTFTVLGMNERPAILMGMDALKLFDRVMIDFVNRRVGFDLPKGVSAPKPGTRLASN